MRTVVIGVDGGGSHTRAAVFDDRLCVSGRAQGAASALDPNDPETSAAAVVETVRAAAREAGVALPAAALHLGVAGAGRDGPRRAVAAELARSGLAARISVGTDAEAALHDAFRDGPGLLLVAGTGSMVLARGSGGEEDRVGGWGPILGDEGSGYAIGRSALRQVARAEDGRAPVTGLRTTVLATTGCEDAWELVGWAAAASRAEVAGLVPAVLSAAEAGDTAALDLLDSAAAALADDVATLARRTGPWSGPVPIAMAGGLVDPGGPLRSRVVAALGPLGAGVGSGRVDPVRGAGALALESVLQG